MLTHGCVTAVTYYVQVRVLSVQRVNNGFNARGFCKERTYHYYLPTTILGLALDGELCSIMTNPLSLMQLHETASTCIIG